MLTKNEFSILFFAVAFTIYLIAYYLFIAFPYYKMYQRANLKNPWIAFIPLIGQFKIFNLANFSMWYYLALIGIAFIPFVGALIIFIFMIYVYCKIFKNFCLGPLGTIIGIFFAPFVIWYIVLARKPFIGQLNPKFTNPFMAEFNPEFTD
ncbi:MAG: hypothetical protein GX889_05585 [Clostridiales bacterium]|nr:hypothetical protein [Clostridiales bacterium]